MNIIWLQTFILIVDKKSLTKAAKVLHLTQPAVSKQLISLEKFYGTALLHRTSRQMELTEAGKMVYEHSLRILSAINESLAEVKALQDDLHGELLLGASSIPGEYILPSALGRFQTLYPQVKVRLEIADSTEICLMLQDGKVEAGMIGVIPENSAIFQEHIFEDELVVIAAGEHPLSKRKSIVVEDFKQERLIFRERGSGTRIVIEKELEMRGIDPEKLKTKLELGSSEAVINAVAAGLGISLVSRFAVENRIKTGEVSVLPVEGFPLKRGL